MAVSMPMIVVMTLITLGVMISLTRRVNIQMSDDLGQDTFSEQLDFNGTPVQEVEDIFTASESTGSAPMDEVFTASETTGPAPMDEVFTASETTGPAPIDEVFTASESTGPAPAPMDEDAPTTLDQLLAILQATNNPDGTPVTLDDRVEIGKEVVDAIDKIETHNTAVLLNEQATNVLTDIIEQKEKLIPIIQNATTQDYLNEELSQVDLARVAELEMRMANLETERNALEAIKAEEIRVQRAEVQRQLDDIAEQIRIEEQREAAEKEERLKAHQSALALYEIEQEKKQSVRSDLLQKLSDHEIDEGKLKAAALAIQTRVNLAKELESVRLENELLKLDDMEDTTEADALREKLEGESAAFVADLEDEIIKANAILDTSISDRAKLLGDIEDIEALIQSDVNDANDLDGTHLSNEQNRLAVIERDRLTKKAESDTLLAINREIEKEHNNAIVNLYTETDNEIARLEDARDALYQDIQDRKDANDKILNDAKDALAELDENERFATEDKLETSKAVVGTEAAMRRGANLNMFMTSNATYTAQHRSILDQVNNDTISLAAQGSCPEQYGKLNTCRDEVFARNEELYRLAMKRITDHQYKMNLGFDITPEEHDKLKAVELYKSLIGFEITPLEHRNLATSPGIEKVIIPEDKRRFTQTGINWMYDGKPVDVNGIFFAAHWNDNECDLELRRREGLDASRNTMMSCGLLHSSVALGENVNNRFSNDIPAMLELDLAAMGYGEYDTSKIFEDQTLNLERFGIPIYEGLENRYANGITDAYYEMSSFGPESEKIACAAETSEMAECMSSLNENGTFMTEDEKEQLMRSKMMDDMVFSCKSDPVTEPIKPMDCYVTWDLTGCENPKIAGVVVPFHVAGYNYGDKFVTVEYPAMFGGTCAYQTGDKRKCEFGDKDSKARQELDGMRMAAGAALGL